MMTQKEFGEIADRWYPLIYRGAIEYSIPGKLDVEDLVQEGFYLLWDEVNKRVHDLKMWALESNDFEKYFKAALFHRFVDRKRQFTTKKRDHKQEVRATDDYDPLANLLIASQDNPEHDLLAEGQYERLLARVPVEFHPVLECLQNTPEELLQMMRLHRCPECLWEGEPTPDGQCPQCVQLRDENPEVTLFQSIGSLVPVGAPNRLLQSNIQEHLKLKRVTMSEAMYTIRQECLRLEAPIPDRASLDAFFEVFSYSDSDPTMKPIPQVASCRYEEGTPFYHRLSYFDLRSIFSSMPDEIMLLDFMVLHTTDYYRQFRFTDLARRTGVSVHRVREAVDSMRVKLEFVENGVPLRDVPQSL